MHTNNQYMVRMLFLSASICSLPQMHVLLGFQKSDGDYTFWGLLKIFLAYLCYLKCTQMHKTVSNFSFLFLTICYCRYQIDTIRVKIESNQLNNSA